jgi:hypothetical protein
LKAYNLKYLIQDVSSSRQQDAKIFKREWRAMEPMESQASLVALKRTIILFFVVLLVGYLGYRGQTQMSPATSPVPDQHEANRQPQQTQ